MKYDYLIVGAGFAGSVMAERLASQLEKKVLIVEKRHHIGGNAYDEYDEHGILVHRYGPHIFHTNSKKVFDVFFAAPRRRECIWSSNGRGAHLVASSGLPNVMKLLGAMRA